MMVVGPARGVDSTAVTCDALFDILVVPPCQPLEQIGRANQLQTLP